MSLVMDVCEHIYVLDFGRLLFEGTPDEVVASPSSAPPTSATRTPCSTPLEERVA